MLALCDAIRGYERELRGGIPVKEINSFKIPSSHIIQRASGLAAHQFHIILDLLRVLLMADERRVAHHIRAFITGQQKTDGGHNHSHSRTLSPPWRRGIFEDAFRRLTSPQRPSLHE